MVKDLSFINEIIILINVCKLYFCHFSECEQCQNQSFGIEDTLSESTTRQIPGHLSYPRLAVLKKYANPCQKKHSDIEVHKLPKRVKLKTFDVILAIIGSYLCILLCQTHLGNSSFH